MMKNIKKCAADLIAIVISVVVIGGLSIAIMSYFSTKMSKTSQDGIDDINLKMSKAVSDANTIGNIK